MRIISTFLGCCLIALFTGCATQRQVAEMEGRGKVQVYDASYDQVWRAAVDAAQIGDLRVRQTDRARGYIAAGRGMRVTTHGENVGIWVRQVGPSQTQVEVVSRHAGPPKLTFKNWESEILNSIAANLSRDMIGTGPVIREPAAASDVYHRDATIMEPAPVSPPPPVYQEYP